MSRATWLLLVFTSGFAIPSPGPAASSPAVDSGHRVASSRVALRDDLAIALSRHGGHEVYGECYELSDPQELVDQLLPLLGSGRHRTRVSALWCLSALDVNPEPGLDQLMQALMSRSRRLRSAAVGCFRRMPPERALPLLAKIVEDTRVAPAFRESAGYALGRMPARVEATRVFVKLPEPARLDAFGRRIALDNLYYWNLDPKDDEQDHEQLFEVADEPLRQALTDPEPLNRLMAAEDLLGLRLESPEAISTLISALQDRNLTTMVKSIIVLKEWGKAHEQRTVDPALRSAAAAALTHPLRNRRSVIRELSAMAIQAMGNEAEVAVLALADALDDRSEEVGYEAAHALRNLGPRGALAIPALERVLKDSASERVRWESAAALGSIGGAAVGSVPALTRALRDRSERVRYEAAKALGSIGPAAASSAPDLVARVDDPVARRGVNTMYSRTTRAALKMECLEAPDVPIAALDSLGRMGPAAAAAIPALESCLHRGADVIRGGCAEALLRIGADPADPVGVLLELMKSPTPPGTARHATDKLGDYIREQSLPFRVKSLTEALRVAEDFKREAMANRLRRSLEEARSGLPREEQ